MFRLLVVSTVVSAGLVVPAQAHTLPLEGLLTNQGSQIRIGSQICPLGFHDETRDVTYVAGDCGRDGDPVGPIERSDAHRGVYLARGERNSAHGNSWGEISWAPGVIPPGNYITPRMADLAEMTTGDEVCFTRPAWGRSFIPVCGSFYEQVGQSFTVRMPAASAADVSARGMLWSPEKGFLGFVEAEDAALLGELPPNARPVIWGSAPRDGAAITADEYREAYFRAAGVAPSDNPGDNPGDNPVNPRDPRPTRSNGPLIPGEGRITEEMSSRIKEGSAKSNSRPSSSERQGSVLEAESEYSTGEIVGIVFGVFFGVALLVTPWLLGVVNITLPI